MCTIVIVLTLSKRSFRGSTSVSFSLSEAANLLCFSMSNSTFFPFRHILQTWRKRASIARFVNAELITSLELSLRLVSRSLEHSPNYSNSATLGSTCIFQESKTSKELAALKEALSDTKSIGVLLEKCRTLCQGKAFLR